MRSVLPRTSDPGRATWPIPTLLARRGMSIPSVRLGCRRFYGPNGPYARGAMTPKRSRMPSSACRNSRREPGGSAGPIDVAPVLDAVDDHAGTLFVDLEDDPVIPPTGGPKSA